MKNNMQATRDGYGKALVELGKTNPRVVVLCADLTESTRTEWFANAFPDRFIQTGIMEQHVVTMAAGLAATGLIPFVSSYAAFSPGRNWEQIRTTIAYNDQPVIIVGGHAGITVGPDGATHQMTEDIALMRCMPNMTVVVPCDAEEARKATHAVAELGAPAYLRLSREPTSMITTPRSPFEIGKAQILKQGTDVTIIGCGVLVPAALQAAQQLRRTLSVQVMNCPTIKPLDSKALLAAVGKTRAVVTVEEANVLGGLGGAVSELLAEHLPIPLERVGMQDCFGQSGSAMELLDLYGLNVAGIMQAVQRVYKRKV